MRYDLYKTASDGANVPQNKEIEAKNINKAGKEYMKKGLIIDFFESGVVEYPDGSSGEIIEENLW